ncbi:MAG: ATP-binding protein [Nitrospirota bacterium]
MNFKNSLTGLPQKYSLCLIGVWTALVAVSAVWNIYQIREEAIERARVEARTIFEHNIAYRRWNTMLGGIYAPVSDINRPNPYIADVSRDIVTTSGARLTLINPFRMTTQAYDLLLKQSPHPAINRTVSKSPLNPENMADAWEQKGITAFEQGRDEVSEITTINDHPYMRIMRPYLTVEGCLKCHGYQGYKVGDIRGGMSIAVPMQPYYEGLARTRKTVLVTHLLLLVAGVVGILRFSGSIHKTQRKIAESEWKFRTLSEFSTDWEYWIKGNREIVYMSPSCERITGYTQEEFIGNPALLCDIVHPDDGGVYRAHMDDFHAAEHEEIEFRIITKDGQVKWLSHVCAPIYADGVFLGRSVSNRDVSDSKRLEEQLVQSQKMESLGLLAGGIAHDFNNLLTAITGYASLLSGMLGNSDEKTGRYVRHVLNASERAQRLTSSLLAFSRKQIMKPAVISLNQVIKEIAGLFKSLIGEDIELAISYSEEEFPVFADPHQIEQVLMNLITNARDAMPTGGVLAIATAAETIDDDFAMKHGVRTGRYMVLSISDTGVGIDRADLPHVFEPFFTTKGKDKGTGLGLAMVYGIVNQHGGAVAISSEKGRGTTFRISLPATEGDGEGAGCAVEAAGDETDVRGDETILVAEDDETVREFLKETLEGCGYTVMTAANGVDAVRKYEEQGGRIVMVIFDIVMPRQSGKEAYERLRAINPAVKAIFVSGYPQDMLTSRGICEEGLHFMPKPLDTKLLMRTIKSMLHGA